MAQYPTSAATDANLYIAVNSLATTLVGALTSSGGNNGANIEVSSTAGFPSAGFITIDLEAIAYTSLLSTPPRFSGITRGADGTTATSHLDTSTVKHNVIAAHHNATKDEVIALTANLITGQHTGTATNDNAAAGKVGEYSSVTQAAFVNFPATTVWGDLSSGLSLTAGDWDVTGYVTYSLNGATSNAWRMGISTTTGNVQPAFVTENFPATTDANITGWMPGLRISLSGTTTVYLKFEAEYTAGTPRAYGAYWARRVR
jgi:hypothetical protein